MKKILGIILILVAAILIWRGISHKSSTTVPPIVIESHDLTSLDIFTKPLSESGVNVDTIGFSSFSPDGKYFMFVGFKRGAVPANQTFLVDLASGEVTNLKGTPQRGFSGSDILELFDSKGLTLYNPKDKTSALIPNSKNTFGGALSPDGNYYVMNGSDGVALYNFETKAITIFSKSSYDGADSWFSDNLRILGFRETTENLLEAGKGRELGIWNIETKIFTPLDIDIPIHTIRNTMWLVPDHIARVNVGFDDGSHDYLVNLDTKKVADLGETSGAVTGGIVTDMNNRIVGVLGAFEENTNYLKIFGSDGTLLYKVPLEPEKIYQDLQIVSDDEVLYIKRDAPGGEGSKDATLIRRNITATAEIALETFHDASFISLSLSPDRKTWVVAVGNRFEIGNI